MHETGEQYLAGRIRVGADDDPNRSKEGNGHCSGSMLEKNKCDRIVSRTRGGGRGCGARLGAKRCANGYRL